MATITPNDFKRGMTILYESQLWEIVSYEFNKHAQREGMMITKMRNLESGKNLEVRFSSSSKIEQAYIEKKPMQYLYREGKNYVFMDPETYEQPSMTEAQVGHISDLMKEGMDVYFTMYESKVLGASLRDFIELVVVEAPPYIKGDTASSEYTRIELETGATIMVPPFVQEGDIVQIDTRNREYVKRVSQKKSD